MDISTGFTDRTKVRHVPHSSGDLDVHRCLCIMIHRDVTLLESRERHCEVG